jgi:phthalate 4,5-dioxygenase
LAFAAATKIEKDWHMLKETDGQLLTQVRKGTPLGEMMRRYWHPIALSEQVAEPDGTPLRTKLLGERFVVFRDTEGKVGVLDEMCMHRGVSLALGRNEEGGLRCVYHGWKFAVDGTILETPNHADCRYRERMKAPAYPVREQSGLIWTYIGPVELQPPFREFEYDTVPPENRVVFRSNTKACWLPLWEGGLDSSHVGILHTNIVRPSWGAKARGEDNAAMVAWDNLAPTYEIEDTEFGYHYCAFRDVPGKEDEVRNARLVPAILPYMRIIPGKDTHNFAIEVPMDDFETATYVFAYSPTRAVDRDWWYKFLGYESSYYDPETCDVLLDWGNRMGQDRSRMKADWSGIEGLEFEDFAMSASLGQDWDRAREHLVTSDLAIVRMRRMVLEAVQQVQEGNDPPAVNVADMTGVVGFDRDIAVQAVWQELAPTNRTLIAAE